MSRDLDAAAVARFRADLTLLAMRYPKREDLAEALGIHQSGLSRILSGKQGASHGLAAKVAELLGKEPATATPRARVTQLDDAYPSRQAAVELVRDLYPESVIKSVLRDVLQSAEDPGLEHWLTEIKSRARQRAAIEREVRVGAEETPPVVRKRPA